MTPRTVSRLGYAVGGVVAPALTGRRAMDAFAVTRPLGVVPEDVPPLGAKTFRIEGNPDVRRGYLWGTGADTALLVHGWGTDSSSMHGLVAPAREAGFRVAAFDAPGHGVSPGSVATIRQFTQSVTAAVDTLGNVRVIVAHSLGAIATIAAVKRRQDLALDGIMLIAPACTLTGALDRWAGDDLRRIPRRVAARVADELGRRNGVPVTHWDIRTLGRWLDVAVLVIHDPADAVVPFSEARAVVAALPKARLAAVRGAGHTGILVAPPTKRLLSAFLAELAESRYTEESRS